MTWTHEHGGSDIEMRKRARYAFDKLLADNPTEITGMFVLGGDPLPTGMPDNVQFLVVIGPRVDNARKIATVLIRLACDVLSDAGS